MRFMDSSSAGGVSQSGGLLDLDPAIVMNGM